MVVKLSQYFYTLYTSLSVQVPIPEQCVGQPLGGDINTISLSENELLQLANNMDYSVSLQQHQVDGYATHFSHLVFNCEIFHLQDF